MSEQKSMLKLYKEQRREEICQLMSSKSGQYDPDEYMVYGACLYELGRMAEAYEVISKCVAESPIKASSRLWTYYILTLVELNNITTASVMFDEAFNLKKMNIKICKQIFRSLAVKSLDGPAQEFRKKLQFTIDIINEEVENLQQNINKNTVNIDTKIIDIVDILVPTYNRKAAISSFLDEILRCNENLNMIISDNASTDGAFEHLVRTYGGYKNIRISQCAMNVGYSGNITNLIKSSTRRYGVICSDEDPLIVENIESAIRHMRDNDIDFLSPIMMRADHIFRGKKSNREMNCEDFHKASFYTSGVIFNLEKLRNNMDSLEGHLLAKGQVYPQVICAMFFLVCGRGSWYSKPTAYKKLNLKGFIRKDVEDGRIGSVIERWRQFRMNIAAARDIGSLPGISPEAQGRANSIIEYLCKTVRDTLAGAATREFPEFAEHFQMWRK